MEEFKGTRGDWCVVRGTDSVWIESPIWTVADIARKDTEQEQIANAKLIAAAPELLDACREAYDLAVKLQMPTERELKELSVTLKKAINKALK